jgi:hypothetical protein
MPWQPLLSTAPALGASRPHLPKYNATQRNFLHKKKPPEGGFVKVPKGTSLEPVKPAYYLVVFRSL